MSNYVVILKKEDAKDLNALGRRGIYESNVGRTADFQRKLRQRLDEKGLSAQVAGIGEPMGFSLITLTSTPAVAREIETFPEVDEVILDNDAIGFVPQLH